MPGYLASLLIHMSVNCVPVFQAQRLSRLLAGQPVAVKDKAQRTRGDAHALGKGIEQLPNLVSLRCKDRDGQVLEEENEFNTRALQRRKPLQEICIPQKTVLNT